MQIGIPREPSRSRTGKVRGSSSHVPLGFGGSEKTLAVHPALSHPVAQLVRRVLLQLVQDAYTSEVFRVPGSTIRGIAIVVFVRAPGLNQLGLVYSGLCMERKQGFSRHVSHPLARRYGSHLSRVLLLVVRDDVSIDESLWSRGCPLYRNRCCFVASAQEEVWTTRSTSSSLFNEIVVVK